MAKPPASRLGIDEGRYDDPGPPVADAACAGRPPPWHAARWPRNDRVAADACRAPFHRSDHRLRSRFIGPRRVSRKQRLQVVLVLNLVLVAGLVTVGATAHSLAV